MQVKGAEKTYGLVEEKVSEAGPRANSLRAEQLTQSNTKVQKKTYTKAFSSPKYPSQAGY
jgi:hypothetical protein